VYTAHGEEGSVGVDGGEPTTSAPEPSAGIEFVDDTAAKLSKMELDAPSINLVTAPAELCKRE
jgi:hypothetical protein